MATFYTSLGTFHSLTVSLCSQACMCIHTFFALILTFNSEDVNTNCDQHKQAPIWDPIFPVWHHHSANLESSQKVKENKSEDKSVINVVS